MIFCVFYSIIYIHFNISDENSMLLAVASSVKSGAYDKGSPAFNWSFDGARSRGPRNLGGRKRNFQVISLSLSLFPFPPPPRVSLLSRCALHIVR